MLTNVEHYTHGMFIRAKKNTQNAAIAYADYAKHNRYKTYGPCGYFPKNTQFKVSDGIDKDGDLQVHLIVDGKPIPNTYGKDNNYFITSKYFKDYELVQ